VRPDGLTVKKCSVCDCRFVAPAPSADELARFYTSYYTGHVSLAPGEFAGKSQCSCPRHDYRLDELRSLTDWSGKAVLDVGCGMGELLEACQRQLHMEIAGVDLDPDAVRRANERLQTQRILQGGIERFLGKSRFDLIIMHDLIEHPLDPLSLLEQASQLLAPSGCLLLWTPNGAFADAAAPAYTTFRVNLEHMQYLTAKTIRFVLDKLPLSIVHLETCGYPALAGIDQPPGGRLTFRSAAKQLARRLVGDRLAQRLRDAWVDWRRPSIRLGSYHLFAILQKDPER
jgi:2-polyprenyl-3-methyl-5-hydroxy-6-metoxy-1,4-benzoquinol methylase